MVKNSDFVYVPTAPSSCHGPKGCGKVSTLGWLLFLLAALLPGSRSKENLEFRRLKSTQQQQTYDWILQHKHGILWRRVMLYRVWVKRGVTCNAVRSGPTQAWGPPAALVWPACLPASSDTALCFWSWTEPCSVSQWPLRFVTRRTGGSQWMIQAVSSLSWWRSTCSCGVRIASNSRLRMPWLFFRADGALSWWVLRLCRASWAPSLVWNLSTIWLARR